LHGETNKTGEIQKNHKIKKVTGRKESYTKISTRVLKQIQVKN